MDQTNVRKPRLRVLVDGQEVPAISAEVTSNNFFQADGWRIECALFADPRFGIDWWDAKSGKPVEIAFGFEVNGSVHWKTQVIGKADNTSYELEYGKICLTGRDSTAKLIARRTTQTYQNMTASAVVQTLAGQVGMTADVTPTQGNVGRYSGGNSTHHSQTGTGQTQTAWDMIIFLARREGYDAWVTGNTIHFHPMQADNHPSRTIRYELPSFQSSGLPVAQHARSDVSRLRFGQQEDLARDVKVIVRSWNSQTGKRIERSFPSADRRVRSTSQGQEVTLFEFTLPNATEEQALQEAQRRYHEIVQHGRTISWEEPGELEVNPRQKVRLTGQVGSYAQEYYVDEVTRSISAEPPLFSQTVRAKNKAPSQDGS
jgi:phage protein D